MMLVDQLMMMVIADQTETDASVMMVVDQLMVMMMTEVSNHHQ